MCCIISQAFWHYGDTDHPGKSFKKHWLGTFETKDGFRLMWMNTGINVPSRRNNMGLGNYYNKSQISVFRLKQVMSSYKDKFS